MKKMFTSVEDLPKGEWVTSHEMIYRIGSDRQAPEEVIRARKAKGISGRRLWENSQTRQVVTCWLSFFASESDATTYVPKFMDRVIRKPFSNHSDKVERRVYLGESSDLSDFQLLYEIKFCTPQGPAGERLVVSNVGRVVFGLDFYAIGEMWQWDEISPVAHRQVERIRSVLPELS